MERHRRVPLKAVSGNQFHAQRAEVPLVYTVVEVAARLKVSQGTVRNMIDEGQLYAIRLHVRRIVIPKWALEELVARPPAADSISPRRRLASASGPEVQMSVGPDEHAFGSSQ